MPITILHSVELCIIWCFYKCYILCHTPYMCSVEIQHAKYPEKRTVNKLSCSWILFVGDHVLKRWEKWFVYATYGAVYSKQEWDNNGYPICCQSYFHWAVGVIFIELTCMSHCNWLIDTDVCHTVTATQARATDRVFLSCKPIVILFEGHFNLQDFIMWFIH